MNVYQTNHIGVFVGVTTTDPDPLDPKNFLIPGGCVTVAPPTIPDGKRARWAAGDWVLEDIPPAPLDPVPSIEERRAAMKLSRRQMVNALAVAGFITDAEALAWAVSNTLPAAIESLVTGLPADQQTGVRIKMALFTEALRLDPMVGLLAAVAPVPLDDAALDAFFTTYASL